MHVQTLCKREKGFNEDTPLVISVASLSKQKDHVTLIKAIAHLQNVHLLIVGDGSLKTKLHEFSISLGLNNRVHFLGYRNDVPELLAAADVFVMSSHWEGFGLAVVEAMAAGVPVIASDVPGLSEVIEHGKSGLLFPARDEAKLAENIRLLLKDKHRRQQLINEGKKRAHYFTIDKTVSQYVGAYDKILRGAD